MNLRRACILSLALGAASAAVAQDPPSEPSESEIVVTGEALERQVRDFVGAFTQAPPRGQLSRFEWDACPVAIGLPEALKRVVVDRMRRVAESAGVPLAGEGCRPNVLVAVTRDKNAFIDELSRRLPDLFTEMSRAESRRIREEPLATAWHVKGPPLNADGHPLRLVLLDPAATPVYMDQTTRQNSRITASTRLHFTAAVVVVEADALDGLTTTQLADYAAMRSFARVDPTRLPSSPPPTILSAIAAPMGSAVPITLTRWDLGFLRGLYGSQGNLYAASQRSEISRQVQNDLTGSENQD